MEEQASGMRINKYLSAHGICSRREADREIAAGNVRIGTKTASAGDRVFPGDKVLVSTERGARIVIVTAVEDYAGQEPEPLRMVIRVRKRAGNRREEYINKINQQLSTIKDTWILDQIYRVTVNIMN